MIDNIKNLLKEAGVSEEQIGTLVNQLADEIGRATVPKKEFNAKAALARSFGERLQQLETENRDLKKAAGLKDSLNLQLSSLQKKRDSEIQGLKAKIEHLKMDYAIDLALLSAGAKNRKAVKSLLDRTKIHYSDRYGLQGLDCQLKRLLLTDGYLFEKKPRCYRSHNKKRFVL